MCRSRRELSNAYLLAKFGFDTAENEPCKVCPLSAYRSPRFLGLLFAQAGHGFVDVIDAENEGGCNAAGTWLTSALAAEASIDVRLTVGRSPDQIPKAVRAPFVYDIAFIDGWHSYDQLLADFEALEPYMAPKSVMVLHDVGLFDLHPAVQRMSRRAAGGPSAAAS